MSAANPSTTTTDPTSSTVLSAVPKVAIAHSFTGCGLRSTTRLPIATKGEVADRMRATKAPTTRPATAATMPATAGQGAGTRAAAVDGDCTRVEVTVQCYVRAPRSRSAQHR